jgi:cytochrome c oxidase accessory protein FixG
MLDPHSLQVTYRIDRGETRGPHKKGQGWEGRGDCIDCNQCVVACPMGIDIRNGPQLECINCGLCIDACDEIMDRVERPRGLIAYDTDAAVAARMAKQPAVYRLVRPRTVYYAAALALVSGLMLWGLAHRTTLDLHVLRDRNPMFVRLHDGSIRDGYTLKIVNRSFYPKTLQASFQGVPNARLKTPGSASVAGAVTIVARANEVRTVRIFVIAQPPFADEDLPAAFVLRDGQAEIRAKTVFRTGADDR